MMACIFHYNEWDRFPSMIALCYGLVDVQITIVPWFSRIVGRTGLDSYGHEHGRTFFRYIYKSLWIEP
jgi:hypothetical protein